MEDKPGMSTITRDNAIDLLKNYNKDPFHINLQSRMNNL